MSKEATVYVKLLEEGSELWRPVNARSISENVFELIGINGDGIEDEVWEFPLHSHVVCEEKAFPDGSVGLVAIAKA